MGLMQDGVGRETLIAFSVFLMVGISLLVKRKGNILITAKY